jgi:hypothetical protein
VAVRHRPARRTCGSTRNGGTCTRQGTAGSYVDAQACASAATAFAASSPDDTIKVKNGTYGTNTLAGTHGTSGHPVTITAADGEAPVLGETQFNASNITLRDITANIYVCKGATGCTAGPSSVSNITIQRVTSQGSWWIRGGSNITISDSELCCWTDFTSQVTDATGVTFDGVTFHDARLVTSGSHTDCMGIFGGTINVTVRNSQFYNCEHADILVDNSVSGTFNQGLLVENNYFDVALTPGVSLGLTKCSPGCVVRNNSFRGSGMSQVDNASGALIYSNIFEGTVNDTSICSNATWTYNLWTGRRAAQGQGTSLAARPAGSARPGRRALPTFISPLAGRLA